MSRGWQVAALAVALAAVLALASPAIRMEKKGTREPR